VRAIGASHFSAERLSAALRISTAHNLPRYESLQPWYNLHDRTAFEAELATLCQRESLAVISYFSLASGFLTGKYRSTQDLENRPRAYRVKDMLTDRGFRILSVLDEVAKDLKATPAQVSLAWLIARGVTAPIASATTVDQLREIIGATHLSLPQPAIDRLTTASA
jgi:aryl-alcohol dehydrogenase-like predicted oxidoreductase